jgi:hypothetical protein
MSAQRHDFVVRDFETNAIAFSSEVGTGSREETASKQGTKPRF